MTRRLIPFFFTLFAITASAQPTGNIELSLAGGKSLTSWHGQADFQALNLAFVHPISPRTDVSLVLAPIALWQPRSWFGSLYQDGNESVHAVSAALLMRRTFNRDSSRVHYYIEGGTGPMWAEKRVPASTSRFNFMSQAGAGVVWMPNSRLPLILGCRYAHISNGGYAPRNPGLNLPSLILGVRFRTATTRRD